MTAGSDGVMSLWDKDKKNKLKDIPSGVKAPISAARYSSLRYGEDSCFLSNLNYYAALDRPTSATMHKAICWPMPSATTGTR